LLKLLMRQLFDRLWPTRRAQRAGLSGARWHAQRGAFSLDLSLALLVSAIAAVAAISAAKQAQDASSAALQADAIMAIRGAAHKLVMGNYSSYQAALPVTRNSVTLADGSSAGQSRRPTVANLRSMDLAVNNALDFGVYKSLTGAGYDITITRSAACATAPGSSDCRVTGLVCLNAALREQSSPAGEVDAPGLGVMLGRMGGEGGASLLGSANSILASDGSWSATNPYGSVAGIVCARFGWGSEGDDYLRVSDTRDPNFQGGQTISGTISGTTTALQVNGNAVVSQDLSVYGAAGFQKLNNQVQLYADKIVNNSGTGSIDSTGVVTGTSVITSALTLNNTASLGSACTTDASAAWGLSGGRYTFMRCTNGLWTSVGGALGAVVGDACTPYGAKALNSTGAELMCTGGQWQLTTSRLGRYVLYSSYNTVNGDTVAKPTCTTGSSGSAAYMAVGSETTTKFQRANRYLTDDGNYWTVHLFDEYGEALNGANVAVLSYCLY
jgi:hypothetical protein